MTQSSAEASAEPAHDDPSRLLLDAVTDYAIFTLDAEGHVASWNTGAERLKGYTPDEIIGRHFSVFYPESDVRAHRPERVLEVARLEGRVEDEGWRVRKDGSRFWANVVVTPIRAEDGALVGFAKVTRDLSERRRAESALHQSEQRFRLLVDAVKDYALYMVAPDGTIVSWSSGAERIKGYSAEEILGRPHSLLYPPEDIERGKPGLALEIALAEGRYEEEGWHVRKDGSHFWADVVVTPVRDESGKLIGFAKVTRDMTERRRAREQLQLSEQRNRELESETLAKDEFLGLVSHELRTPLTILYGGTRLLAQRYNNLDESSRKELVASLASEAGRMKSLIESVFLLVNPSPNLTLEPVLLNEEVTLAASDFKHASPGRELRVSLPEQDSMVMVESPLFQRVLLNLLGNADKYSPSLTPIEVTVARNGTCARVEVMDRGPGVDPAELDRIFSSFYRSPATSGAVTGKGIGLAVCRRLVGLFGGTIQARARTGGGLTVRVELPLYRDAIPHSSSFEDAN